MSMRLEMLQVARLAPKSLGESTELVKTFVKGQLSADGGFKDRSGKADLYYTLFGIESLLALQCELPAAALESYLNSFHDGRNLDFVHLACLARCWSALWSQPVRPVAPPPPPEPAPAPPPKPDKKRARFQKTGGTAPPPVEAAPSAPAAPDHSGLKKAILRRIERYRSFDGGYNPSLGSLHGTSYSVFLAVGAYQDLGGTVPDQERLVQCLKLAGTDESDWKKEPTIKSGSTPATAAAITLIKNLGLPIHPDASKKLMARAHKNGGFLATANAPVPDLLSTATALHALAALQAPLGETKEKCLDFVDTLWTNEGGFHAHWKDDALDVEYVFYGLLALGHLTV